MRRRIYAGIIVLIAAGFLAHFLFYVTPSIRGSSVPAESSLEGTWEACLPATPDVQGCTWVPTKVPSEVFPFPVRGFSGWVAYRVRFTAPSSCLAPLSACSFFAGEIDDAVEARLDGVSIGRRGEFPPNALYSKHYPVKFDLSRNLLKKGDQANELVLLVYSLKKTQAGIRRGPVGIYTGRNAFTLAQSFTAMTVVVPIICFTGLFLLALFTSIFNLRADEASLQFFVAYCFVSALFSLSFSELPREYLPIGVAGFLHFILRFLSAWAYFEMIREYFQFGSWATKVVRPLYVAALMLYLLVFAGQSLAQSGLRGGGFDAALLTLQVMVPLLWAPHLLGLAGAWRERGTAAGRFFVGFFFAILLCQIHDTLIFHGYATGTYAVKIYPLIVALCFGSMIWKRQQEEREKLLIANEKSLHAAQVAHDIASPLAALKSVMTDLSDVPDESRQLLTMAVGRIDDIATALAGKHRRQPAGGPVADPPQPWLLSSLIAPIIDEKRLEYRSSDGIEISANLDGGDCFAKVATGEFKRLLSNLINNAVEACGERGKVTVSLGTKKDRAVLEIADNGPGIAPDVLERLGRRGETHGKAGGSGLGLYHAKTCVESWGGTFAIESVPGRGATVRIELRNLAG